MPLFNLFRKGQYINYLGVAILLLSLSILSTPASSQIGTFQPQYQPEFASDTWFTDMSARMARFIKSPEKRREILKRVRQEAERVRLKPGLILAIIHTESSFNRFAVSSAGAQGLMQVMPFWKQEIGQPDDNLIRIGTNLRYGCTILRHYLSIEKGNLTRALARYNGSLGKRHYPEKVYTNWETYWQ
ncbi:lytic transglycosylase domain-containing protein [Candidatus Sororendozoicomonas aggregata]|uniref:lytic transglycosylase domain-containing protein n=1 Tax=Candidatus Sororendozoicomonas aggregata TaxID=3073239 RepID=UPI002ED46CF7